MGQTVLVTGANGFLGSHLVDGLLAEGYEVRGMVRPQSDLRWLQNKPVKQVCAALDDPEALRSAVRGVNAIVHNAGVTSGPTEIYRRVNLEGTVRMLDAVLAAAPNVQRFVFVSSQAAGGPTTGTQPRREDDLPQPISEYGWSKLAAEKHLLTHRERLPVTILRPPSIVGPRDRNLLPAFRLVKRGWAIRIAGLEEFSLAFVNDVVRQAIVQLEHPAAVGETFHVAGPEPVSIQQFVDGLQDAVGRKCRLLVVPGWLAKTGYGVLHRLMRAVGQTPPFSPDKLLDLTLARWTITGEKARRVLGLPAPTPIWAALQQTAAWYRSEGWL